MALYHFNVTQVSRGKGQSSVASASYISGEKLYDKYYGKTHDYTYKEGVLYSEVLLPAHAPERLKDRETLWNEVEEVEKHPKAQLCYSFNFALQNELSYEENEEIAKRFIKENFLSRGMIVDYAIHNPSRNDNVPNPHVHMLIPIRPLNKDGTWGQKQRREYIFDEYNNPVLDDKGKQKFNAVPTTDWGSPETLNEWRKNYADIFNEAFEKKGLDCRIDHRSFAELGLDILPTIHEGPHVRAMEAKGIRTEIGDHNRQIKQLNKLLIKLADKFCNVFDWLSAFLKECKEKKVYAPGLDRLLNDYYDKRYHNAWSKKAKIANIKERSNVILFLEQHHISSFEELEAFVKDSYAKVNALEKDIKAKSSRINDINEAFRYLEMYQKTLPVYEELNKKFFKPSKDKFKAEHSKEINQYHLSKRKIAEFWGDAEHDWKGLREEQKLLSTELYTMKLTCKDLEAIASKAYKIRCITEASLEEVQVKEQQKVQERTPGKKRSHDMER